MPNPLTKRLPSVPNQQFSYRVLPSSNPNKNIKHFAGSRTSKNDPLFQSIHCSKYSISFKNLLN